MYVVAVQIMPNEPGGGLHDITYIHMLGLLGASLRDDFHRSMETLVAHVKTSLLTDNNSGHHTRATSASSSSSSAAAAAAGGGGGLATAAGSHPVNANSVCGLFARLFHLPGCLFAWFFCHFQWPCPSVDEVGVCVCVCVCMSLSLCVSISMCVRVIV